MSFLQQYDRLFVLTFGLVNLLRGLGGLGQMAVGVLAPGAGEDAGGDAGLGSFAALQAVVLLISGLGLLARRRLGWQLSVYYHTYEMAKLAAALALAALLGATPSGIGLSTDLLVQMTWALFNLLVFLMPPIARLCRIDGSIGLAAGPWIFVGFLVAVLKLLVVL